MRNTYRNKQKTKVSESRLQIHWKKIAWQIDLILHPNDHKFVENLNPSQPMLFFWLFCIYICIQNCQNNNICSDWFKFLVNSWSFGCEIQSISHAFKKNEFASDSHSSLLFVCFCMYIYIQNCYTNNISTTNCNFLANS
jgi:hypothetical protein